MCVSSIVNIAESIFFVDVDNDSCYDSYARNPVLDMVIFIVVRILSHYLFLLSCLCIFRAESAGKRYNEISSDSEISYRNDLERNTGESPWNYSMPVVNFNSSESIKWWSINKFSGMVNLWKGFIKFFFVSLKLAKKFKD